jgi:hypothetical protein
LFNVQLQHPLYHGDYSQKKINKKNELGI